MAEGAVTQVKEIIPTAFHSARHTPILALGIVFLVLFAVLLLEAYKPGLLTGPVRRGLTALGLKSA